MKAVLKRKDYDPKVNERIVYKNVKEVHIQWDGVYLTLDDGKYMKALLNNGNYILDTQVIYCYTLIVGVHE